MINKNDLIPIFVTATSETIKKIFKILDITLVKKFSVINQWNSTSVSKNDINIII